MDLNTTSECLNKEVNDQNDKSEIAKNSTIDNTSTKPEDPSVQEVPSHTLNRITLSVAGDVEGTAKDVSDSHVGIREATKIPDGNSSSDSHEVSEVRPNSLAETGDVRGTTEKESDVHMSMQEATNIPQEKTTSDSSEVPAAQPNSLVENSDVQGTTEKESDVHMSMQEATNIPQKKTTSDSSEVPAAQPNSLVETSDVQGTTEKESDVHMSMQEVTNIPQEKTTSDSSEVPAAQPNSLVENSDVQGTTEKESDVHMSMQEATNIPQEKTTSDSYEVPAAQPNSLVETNDVQGTTEKESDVHMSMQEATNIPQEKTTSDSSEVPGIQPNPLPSNSTSVDYSQTSVKETDYNLDDQTQTKSEESETKSNNSGGPCNSENTIQPTNKTVSKKVIAATKVPEGVSGYPKSPAAQEMNFSLPQEVLMTGLSMLAQYSSDHSESMDDADESDESDSKSIVEVKPSVTYRDNAVELDSSTESDSSPASESDDEQFKAKIRATLDKSMERDDDESDDENCTGDKVTKRKPPRVKGELLLEDLPPIQDLHITVPEEECVVLGKVHSIVDQLVLVSAMPNAVLVDLDTVLFLEKGKRVLGEVFDVLGQVADPLYCVRFNSNDQIQEKGISTGDAVYVAPKTEHTQFVILSNLIGQRGSDASWENDVEPPPRFIDYSDDEEERQARMRNRTKNRSNPIESDESQKRTKRQNTDSSNPSTSQPSRGAITQYRGRGRGRGQYPGPNYHPGSWHTNYYQHHRPRYPPQYGHYGAPPMPPYGFPAYPMPHGFLNAPPPPLPTHSPIPPADYVLNPYAIRPPVLKSSPPPPPGT